MERLTDNQRKLIEGMMRLFPNDCKVITIKETKRSKQIATDVRKYVLGIEKAHKRAAHSTLTFKG